MEIKVVEENVGRKVEVRLEKRSREAAKQGGAKHLEEKEDLFSKIVDAKSPDCAILKQSAEVLERTNDTSPARRIVETEGVASNRI